MSFPLSGRVAAQLTREDKKPIFNTRLNNDYELLKLSSSVNGVEPLTAPLTRGAPLLSFNANGISDISPVLRWNCPIGEASCGALRLDVSTALRSAQHDERILRHPEMCLLD